MTRLEQHYRDKVAKDLQAQFSYQSTMQIPRITKITLNMGVGEASQDKKTTAVAKASAATMAKTTTAIGARASTSGTGGRASTATSARASTDTAGKRLSTASKTVKSKAAARPQRLSALEKLLLGEDSDDSGE